MKCSLCWRDACNHHIVSRGARGSNDPANLIPLCYMHHTEVHTIGVLRFAKKHNLVDRFKAAYEHEKRIWDIDNYIKGNADDEEKKEETSA